MQQREYVISIAGFDPSSGAGVSSDIKTFEAHGVYGLGVCTSVTFQNDVAFDGLLWLSPEEISNQLEMLLKRFPVSFFKIGLIKSLDMLEYIVDCINIGTKNPLIIWDSVLKASAGYVFIENIDQEKFRRILKKIQLITPNMEELKIILSVLGLKNEKEILKFITEEESAFFLVKGGHREGREIDDILYTSDKTTRFPGVRYSGGGKHGSGCVLSSSILANLAKGETMENACMKAKEYIHRFLLSNSSKLGYHYYD